MLMGALFGHIRHYPAALDVMHFLRVPKLHGTNDEFAVALTDRLAKILPQRK